MRCSRHRQAKSSPARSNLRKPSGPTTSAPSNDSPADSTVPPGDSATSNPPESSYTPAARRSLSENGSAPGQSQPCGRSVPTQLAGQLKWQKAGLRPVTKPTSMMRQAARDPTAPPSAEQPMGQHGRPATNQLLAWTARAGCAVAQGSGLTAYFPSASTPRIRNPEGPQISRHAWSSRGNYKVDQAL